MCDCAGRISIREGTGRNNGRVLGLRRRIVTKAFPPFLIVILIIIVIFPSEPPERPFKKRLRLRLGLGLRPRRTAGGDRTRPFDYTLAVRLQFSYTARASWGPGLQSSNDATSRVLWFQSSK